MAIKLIIISLTCSMMEKKYISVSLSQIHQLQVKIGLKNYQITDLTILLNKIRMKTNFDINLPSIPSKIIKFKIQDIKGTAFNTQQPRFSQNKQALNAKFIDSFDNFHQSDLSRTTTYSQQQQTFPTSKLLPAKTTPPQFRYVIPQDKKSLLNISELHKIQKNAIKKLKKRLKGYSFSKCGKFNNAKEYDEQDNEGQLFHSQYLLESNRNLDKQSENKTNARDKPYRFQKISAAFKTQSREKAYKQMNKSLAPGPGAYHQQPKSKVNPKATPSNTQAPFNYKNLKKLIKDIVGIKKPQKQPLIACEEPARGQYMFVRDDRDRFGNMKFPIAQPSNNPGPGSYQINGNIQDVFKKVQLVEKQRRLLRQWFND